MITRSSTHPSPTGANDDRALRNGRFEDDFAWSCPELVAPERVGDRVTVRSLWQCDDARALLVHFAPGARFPAVAAEHAEVLLLAGSIADQRRSYEAGTFIHVPAGDSRDWHSDSSAELFVLLHCTRASGDV